jgi:predicted transcriptional regulator of viral defense system
MLLFNRLNVYLNKAMDKITAIQRLNKLDKQARYVFNLYDLKKIFPEDSLKTLHEGLNRLVKANILSRACRGIYVNEQAHSFNAHVIEHIAKALRRGEYSYVSLESILSEYGLISQIPIDRLTVITTGRSGIHKTKYGVIEFIHTKRSINDIIENIQTEPGRPLRIASKKAAVRDLKRVGRNLDLLIQEDLNDE